ncbi:MAG: choice-of-anchor tandem repeat GloVer-containing protein [Candidatus Korobacteraceae bacterium]|jgi:hypothetical protein
MQGKEQSLSSVFRTISLAAIATLVMAMAIVPAWAQNSVPPTAVQAAKMPQFATRLAHHAQAASPANASRVVRPARLRASNKSAPLACSQKQARWLPEDYIYNNGPTNGTSDAWTINFGFIVSDSFPIPAGGATITGATFAMWLAEGDTLESAQLSITSGENGGTSYFNQTVSFAQSGCSANQYAYDVCTEGTSFNGPALNAGTYWVNFQNAVTAEGQPIYWDENSGPSSASENEVGTIPSESFTILGNASTTTTGNSCMPEQYGNFSVIHDFSGEGDGRVPAGVAVDSAGNLYGPAGSTGGGPGTVFKLAEAGSGWLLNTLYNFLGGNNGASPDEVIVGRNGILYGSAGGGVDNCTGVGYCGLIFSLRPSPNACLTGSCSWTENVLYTFTGPTDASQGTGLVADQAGNLYGVSQSGGALQRGAVFELSPSIGGWVESILYNFTGGSDGGQPTALLLSNDGNLYGLAGTGGANASGVVFRLTPSANGWTETVVSSLPYSMYFTSPHSLIQDSAGNLFGEWHYWYQESGGGGETLGVIFELSPSNGGWTYTELRRGTHQPLTNDIFFNLILDTAGNLWGTGGGAAGCYNPILHGYIFELARTNDGWQYGTPVYWDNTDFSVSGATAMDAHNNLYGTTSDCGAHNQGTVWQFSP